MLGLQLMALFLAVVKTGSEMAASLEKVGHWGHAFDGYIELQVRSLSLSFCFLSTMM
jgi:hypothetical protein